MKYYILIIAVIVSCKSNVKATKTNQGNKIYFVPQYIPGPQALIYKTKSDYSKFVPVTLSENKLEILSYPDPKDILVNNSYPIPTLLSRDYLLDNRGINKNVAFLKYTYEDYSKLKEAPSLKELHNSILDADPLQELCDCGNKTVFKDISKQLNELIDADSLRVRCKVIK